MTYAPFAGLALLLLAPAAAAQTPVTTTVRVAHADLDLTTRSGLAVLNSRIARAAKQACGTTSPLDLGGKTALRRCREQARRTGLDQRDQLVRRARSVEVAAGR